MDVTTSRVVKSLGRRIAVVFVVATAVISQCLEWLRMGLGINSEVVALAQYGPALAALVTWLIFRHTIRQVMPARVSNARVRGRLVLAVAACGLFAIVLWIGYFLIGGRDTYGIQTIGGIPFWLISVIWLAGATAEEMGWRGVLQPALETVLPRWGAGIVTGLLWSVWHLPMIMLGGAVALAFIATTIVMSVMMAFLGDGSPAQRVITTSIVHWLINLAILVIAGVSPTITGLTSELAAISMTTLVVLTLLALIARHRTRTPNSTALDVR